MAKKAAPKQIEEQEQQTTPEMFAKLRDLYTNQFVKELDKRKVTTAIAIVIDPEHPDQPLVYDRGEIYEQAKLLAAMLRGLRDVIDRETST